MVQMNILFVQLLFLEEKKKVESCLHLDKMKINERTKVAMKFIIVQTNFSALPRAKQSMKLGIR